MGSPSHTFPLCVKYSTGFKSHGMVSIMTCETPFSLSALVGLLLINKWIIFLLRLFMPSWLSAARDRLHSGFTLLDWHSLDACRINSLKQLGVPRLRHPTNFRLLHPTFALWFPSMRSSNPRRSGCFLPFTRRRTSGGFRSIDSLWHHLAGTFQSGLIFPTGLSYNLVENLPSLGAQHPTTCWLLKSCCHSCFFFPKPG